MTEEMKTLKQWVEESEHIVFFGGAGVSTESGIPDFRSVDGLYNQKYDYPPETILSHEFFWANTAECPHRAGEAGEGRQAGRRRHPEHRRPASGRRERSGL